MRTRAGTAAVGVREAGRDWWKEAACIEHAATIDFFPARGESSVAAKAICARCSVRAECLEYALQWDPLCGVWGGHSERERRQLKRRQFRSDAG
ncbi:MAG: WhiB family transcriptional regulator [Actinomycetota bacterium]